MVGKNVNLKGGFPKVDIGVRGDISIPTVADLSDDVNFLVD